MWHLLMAHQQESFYPFSSRQSRSCLLSHVAKGSTPKPRGPRKDTRSQKETPNGCLGLNPSANLPLQPHFRLLPQLVTAASIPGRCGPVVCSQLFPSSPGPHYKSVFGTPPLVAPLYIDNLHTQIVKHPLKIEFKTLNFQRINNSK